MTYSNLKIDCIENQTPLRGRDGNRGNQRMKLNLGLRRMRPRSATCTKLNLRLLFVHERFNKKAELGLPV